MGLPTKNNSLEPALTSAGPNRQAERRVRAAQHFPSGLDTRRIARQTAGYATFLFDF